MDQKKTHTVAKGPQMSIRHLADFMAASEQAKRTIVQGCKYRPIARVIQHNEARAIIANFLRSENRNVNELKEKATFVRKKLADSEFETDVNGHNADYIDRFVGMYEATGMPFMGMEILPGKKLPAQVVNGVKVTFSPDLILRRTTRTNKIKTGAVLFRYAKGKALPTEVAAYQSAAIYGFLRTIAEAVATEVDLPLCVTFDMHSGVAHGAPGDSSYRFNNIKAACQTIFERWSAIPEPKGAIL